MAYLFFSHSHLLSRDKSQSGNDADMFDYHYYFNLDSLTYTYSKRVHQGDEIQLREKCNQLNHEEEQNQKRN